MALRNTFWFSLLALAPAACNESPAAAAPSDWPAGTVVAVDDVPISLDEVDEASVWIERIDPKSSGPQLRRLALTNVSLPRALAEAMAPEERARAEREAGEALAALRAGTFGEPPEPPESGGRFGEIVEGNWQDLSISVWGRALDLPLEQWSEPIDDIGRFLLVRVIERTERPHAAALVVKAEVLAFPYLPEEADVEAAKDHHHLTIVDPAWRTIVPEKTQYRMGAR